METHSAQAKGVAAVAVVAVADKQRQQQHYTHHYVERFSVIDDMGPGSRGSLSFSLPLSRSLCNTVPPATRNASLAVPERGRETEKQRETSGAPDKREESAVQDLLRNIKSRVMFYGSVFLMDHYS